MPCASLPGLQGHTNKSGRRQEGSGEAVCTLPFVLALLSFSQFFVCRPSRSYSRKVQAQGSQPLKGKVQISTFLERFLSSDIRSLPKVLFHPIVISGTASQQALPTGWGPQQWLPFCQVSNCCQKKPPCVTVLATIPGDSPVGLVQVTCPPLNQSLVWELPVFSGKYWVQEWL